MRAVYGYFQHFFFPLVRERVDVYEVRAGFFGYEFRVSPVEFLLDENDADLFFFAKPDEPDELCGDGSLPSVSMAICVSP